MASIRHQEPYVRHVNDFKRRFKSRIETIQLLKADKLLMTHTSQQHKQNCRLVESYPRHQRFTSLWDCRGNVGRVWEKSVMRALYLIIILPKTLYF